MTLPVRLLLIGYPLGQFVSDMASVGVSWVLQKQPNYSLLAVFVICGAAGLKKLPFLLILSLLMYVWWAREEGEI
jgi:hypothetical protein